MKVEEEKTIKIDDEHSIEFGFSSWNSNERSIRRRKQNINGVFSPNGSSEIPINGFIDISFLICECLKEDLLDNQNIKTLYNELQLSATRKNITLP